MIKFLTGRETGLDDPLLLSRTETTRRIYSVNLSKYKDVESVHVGPINCLDIDAVENRYMLSGGTQGRVAIHDLENPSGNINHTYKFVCGVPMSSPHGHKKSVETVQWYPLDTGIFMTSGSDGLLKVWDANSLLPAETFNFKSIVYSHHMSHMATQHCLVAVGCQSSQIRLVDTRKGSSTHTLNGHKSGVVSVKWSSRDEYLLASGSHDHRVLLWDVRKAKGCLMSLDKENGEKIVSLGKTNTAHSGSVNGMSFTKDGLFLLTFGRDDRIRLWDTMTGKNTLVNYGRVDNGSPKGLQICITKDGTSDVVCIPSYSNMELFDLHQGLAINSLHGHYNHVNCVVCHPHTQEIFSGGSDQKILVWLPTGDESVYDEFVIAQREQANRTRGKAFTSRVGAAADTWSDDDDD